jgi:hypothetical protein
MHMGWLDRFDHGAAVLLIKAIAAWTAEHGGPPSSSAERRAFKEVIQQWRRTIDGIPVEEENFDVCLLAHHQLAL